MRIPLYQVDAFTSRLFGGNPAAVCPLAERLPDATMQAIAAENNLAETAFFVAQGEGYLLRWFKDAGVPAELHIYAAAGHGFGVRDSTAGAVAHWPARLDEWLADKVLKTPRRL